MPKYNLLIKNGHLIDAANGLDGGFDIGIYNDKVAEVSSELNPDAADDIFDADGKLVFPGLVDTHVHLTHTRQPVGFQMLVESGRVSLEQHQARGTGQLRAG